MRVAIVNIATGPYLDLWKRLLPQLDAKAFLGHDVEVHILTDDPESARAEESSRVRIVVHEVPPYRWPDATLRRYEMISNISDSLKQTDVVMYLDVDMDIARPFGDELRPEGWQGGLALAVHPGFRRVGGFAGFLRLLLHPHSLISDLRILITKGTPPGAWESRAISLAYIPRRSRRTYVHGAVWMGRTPELLEMCALLRERTDADRDAGVMATWHDESHLNWYFATHDASLLDASYSCVAGWWQTEDLDHRIVSVPKSDGYR